MYYIENLPMKLNKSIRNRNSPLKQTTQNIALYITVTAMVQKLFVISTTTTTGTTRFVELVCFPDITTGEAGTQCHPRKNLLQDFLQARCLAVTQQCQSTERIRNFVWNQTNKNG